MNVPEVLVPYIGRWYTGDILPHKINSFLKKVICYARGKHQFVSFYDEGDNIGVYCKKCFSYAITIPRID